MFQCHILQMAGADIWTEEPETPLQKISGAEIQLRRGHQVHRIQMDAEAGTVDLPQQGEAVLRAPWVHERHGLQGVAGVVDSQRIVFLCGRRNDYGQRKRNYQKEPVHFQRQKVSA